MLNFAAETVNCKEFILYILVLKIISHKTVYNDSSEFFLKSIQTLQLNNSFV